MRKQHLFFLFILGIFAPGCLSAQTEDLNKLYNDALAQWTDGRPEDAAEALKYVVYRSSGEQPGLSAIMDISVILGEANKNEEAMAYLLKGDILKPDDPYINLEKGWNLLSLEKDLDAKTAFEKVFTLSTDQSLIQQARLGLAITQARLSGPEESISVLRSIYTAYPYLLTPAAELISATFEKLKKRQHALTFLKETLTYDPRNIQAEINLARLFEESGYYVPAWQTYYTLSDMDPGQKFFAEKKTKLAKYVKGKLEDLLYWTRLAWPIHNHPVPYAAQNLLKIALYADPDGIPAPVTAFSFICNSDFEIVDQLRGKVASGHAGNQWTARYNTMNRVIEILDNSGSPMHTTLNPVRIEQKTKGGVLLIKSPEINMAIAGVNRGDKEITGELSISFAGPAMRLINIAPVETLVPALAAQYAEGSKLIEELKALAVVVRTRLLGLKREPPHRLENYDICDSDHCLAFRGLQMETDTARRAAELTKDEILYADSAPASAAFHRACGGFTEDGVDDGAGRLKKISPFEFYSRTLAAPPDNLLCLAKDKTTSSDVYWTLLLNPRWIEARANLKYKIGYLKAIIPLKRAASGRVLTLRLEGTAGSAVLNSFAEISRILSAGTMRSALFGVKPVLDGKYPKFFILRGLGTGNGRGYCILGGHGMADNFGADYRRILSHYFPYYKAKKVTGSR
ncbi:MAG: hypothetical protein A2021_07930 [Elusimicrobia bacterium GWF2_52_66]|nr:MAG: hypothetical protein A2X33_04545 [Elusimicrobia bacterium GWA2_51_34]OGR87339.1 MAG: hypothetical protein A2021_07930 [Elusimicrobia bacterium GWF2_52_66]HAF94925.1 hypothetical protein [Elusimicrobiota bacterium]HCE97501.1 hypothetical protein [Elusimicrobiota bacterium]